MSSLSKELVQLILQFLNEENFKETAHTLEKESGCFFNMKYFKDIVMNGELDEVEKYVAGFTKFDDNRYSTKIFFEIRKQKYLEALDRGDDAKAAEILRMDIKAFSTNDEELFKEVKMLMSLDNFRFARLLDLSQASVYETFQEGNRHSLLTGLVPSFIAGYIRQNHRFGPEDMFLKVAKRVSL